MSPRSAARGFGVTRWRLAGAAILIASATGCAGAKRGKVVGPPPEYEPPEAADAAPPWIAESAPDAAKR
jgi:hypothetical protein